MSDAAELHPHRAPSPLSSLFLFIFSQCPQTLTAAGAEVWVGAHYSLAEPRQKGGDGFFKREKIEVFFFGLLYFLWANPTPCVV